MQEIAQAGQQSVGKFDGPTEYVADESRRSGEDIECYKRGEDIS
jgi:hypothetical protein